MIIICLFVAVSHLRTIRLYRMTYILLCLLCLVTLTISSSVRLNRDEDGYFGIRTTLLSPPAITATEIFIMTAFSDENWIDADTHALLVTSNASNVSLVILDTWEDLVVPMCMIVNSRPNNHSTDWIIGLNPGSSTIEQFGPITIRSDATDFEVAEMFLYSSRNFFETICFPNSTIHFPHETGQSFVETNVSFWVAVGDDQEHITSQSRLIISNLENFHVLGVPRSVRSTIVRVMTELGAQEHSPGSNLFSDCLHAMMTDDLPPIILHLALPSGEAQIVVDSLDYLTFFEEQEYCYLGLSVIDESSAERNFAAIDFFKLQDIHLHISSSGISVCDAL
jgi:hypothetical protein